MRIELRSPLHELIRFEIKWWANGEYQIDYLPDSGLIIIHGGRDILDEIIALGVIDPTEVDYTLVEE